MSKDFSFNIDKKVFNIFSSKDFDILTKEYSIDKYYTVTQIHSDKIYIIDSKYKNDKKGDALITNEKNIPLVIKVADCLAIILYDKKNNVLAAIHAGWRGVLKNITKKTLQLMMKKFNTNPQDVKAYIYPSIRKCHFEVDLPVYQQFKEKYPNIDNFTSKKNNKYYIDLQSLEISILKNNFVKKIYDSKICTYCYNNTFNSYRYNQTKKRNYLITMLKEDNQNENH